MSLVLGLGCGGSHGTIGAMLGQRADGRLFIRETPERLPAAAGGVQPDDEVLLIDGIDVRTLDSRGIHGVLSGEAGTRVKLTLVRDESIVRVTLERRAPGALK
jgi:carboxyl-terminal processing protease